MNRRNTKQRPMNGALCPQATRGRVSERKFGTPDTDFNRWGLPPELGVGGRF